MPLPYRISASGGRHVRGDHIAGIGHKVIHVGLLARPHRQDDDRQPPSAVPPEADRSAGGTPGRVPVNPAHAPRRGSFRTAHDRAARRPGPSQRSPHCAPHAPTTPNHQGRRSFHRNSRVLGSGPELAHDGARIQRQLGGVAAQAAGRVERPLTRKPYACPTFTPGREPVYHTSPSQFRFS